MRRRIYDPVHATLQYSVHSGFNGFTPKRTARSGKLHAPVDEEKLCVGRQLCHFCACARCQEAPAGLCREWNHVEAVVMETRQANDLVAAVLILNCLRHLQNREARQFLSSAGIGQRRDD